MGTESMSRYIVGPHSPLDCGFCLIVRKNICENLLPSNILFMYVQCLCVLPVLRHPPSALPVYQRTRMQILIDKDVIRHDISMCETYSILHLHLFLHCHTQLIVKGFPWLAEELSMKLILQSEWTHCERMCNMIGQHACPHKPRDGMVIWQW